LISKSAHAVKPDFSAGAIGFLKDNPHGKAGQATAAAQAGEESPGSTEQDAG